MISLFSSTSSGLRTRLRVKLGTGQVRTAHQQEVVFITLLLREIRPYETGQWPLPSGEHRLLINLLEIT